MWIPFESVRTVSQSGPLGDVNSHLEVDGPYRDPDPVTWTHEATHAVNSAIRNAHGTGWNAAYLLNDQAWAACEPVGVALADIARAVPQDMRGRGYQLYLIDQQRYLNGQPLYVCDELAAYCNGTAQAIVGGANSSRLSSTLESSIEFLGYSTVLYDLCKSPDVLAFMRCMAARIYDLLAMTGDPADHKARYLAVVNRIPNGIALRRSAIDDALDSAGD